MITYGFVGSYSDLVTLNSPFQFRDGNGNVIPGVAVSSYVGVFGTAGDIVFVNQLGYVQYLPGAFLGYNPISATQILSSATVNGTMRTTNATGLSWVGSVNQ